MPSQQPTPPLEASTTDNNVRKRVCKACDRCRLKKSKCDGSNPCSRCKADNAVCMFGERKKSHDKVYPKGYVEMLEQQQSQLVMGLQELYKRTQNGQGWIGAPLKDTGNGYPLTHDILDRLGALKSDNRSKVDVFEEDLDSLQRRLFENGAGPMQRTSSISSDSDHGRHQSSQFDSPTSYGSPFEIHNAPPTPIHSPFPRTSQINNSYRAMSLYTSPLQIQNCHPSQLQTQSWSASAMTPFEESMDMGITSTRFDDSMNFDMASMPYSRQTLQPAMMTGYAPEWNPEEDMSLFIDQTVV